MGLDVYFRRDMANVLRAVASADQAAALNQEEESTQCEDYYHKGFEAALIAVGLGFGLHQMVSRDRCDGPTWIEMETGD